MTESNKNPGALVARGKAFPIIVGDGISDIKDLPSSLAGAASRASEQALMEWTVNGRVPLTVLVVGPKWPADEVRFTCPSFCPESAKAEKELAARVKRYLHRTAVNAVDGMVLTSVVHRGYIPKGDPHTDELLALIQKNGVQALPWQYRQECLMVQIADGRRQHVHMITRAITRKNEQPAMLERAELQSFSSATGLFTFIAGL